MVLVKNPDRHLEKFLQQNEYDYESSKFAKVKKPVKEKTPEQQEVINKRMSDLRSKRKLKDKKNKPIEKSEDTEKNAVKLNKKIKKV